MSKVAFAILSLLVPFSLFSFHFADVAKEILHEFESKGIKSTYAKELHENVREVSKDFTDYLSYIKLERFVPRVHLEYMATHIANTRPNVRIAMLWPCTKGHDEYIHTHFKKYFTILMYKRILLDKNGALNFLDQLRGFDPEESYDLLFNPPQNKETPVRVFLLEGSNNTIDKKMQECTKNIGCVLYHTKDHQETMELAKIVFNKNSLHCIKHRDFAKGRLMASNRVPHKKDTIYTADALLYAYGQKDSYHQHYYSYEKPLDYVSRHETVYTIVSTPKAYTNIGFHRYGSDKRTLNTDDLLYNPNYHLYFHGNRYTSLDVTYLLLNICPFDKSDEIKNQLGNIQS